MGFTYQKNSVKTSLLFNLTGLTKGFLSWIWYYLTDYIFLFL